MGSCETCTLVSTIVHYFHDVVCSKFGEVWEMPWIFKVASWMCDSWPKINKSPTVSNGVGVSSFEIWTASLAQSFTVGTLTNSRSFILGNSNWKFCSQLPCRPPKPRHSDADISDFGFFFFFFLLFFSEKIKTCWIYTRTLYSQTGKNTKWAETFVWCLLLIFKVVYRDHFTQLLPFARDFVAKGQRLVWSQVG